jgi:hypothetical protein
MCWSNIETQLKQSLQRVFDQIGFGTSENTYHNATFAQLCQVKHSFECSHMRCSLHNETFAPIAAATDALPSGCMRSDIAIEWRPHVQDKKRKHGDDDQVVGGRHLFIIELKATATPLASGAVMQLMCYMKSFGAQRGLLCNFSQRCRQLDDAMKRREELIERLHFKIDDANNVSVQGRYGDMPLRPTIETIAVTLTAAQDEQ